MPGEQEGMNTIKDLNAVHWIDDSFAGLERLKLWWDSTLAGMYTEDRPSDNNLREMLFDLLKHSTKLAMDIAHYKRPGHGDHTYKLLYDRLMTDGNLSCKKK